MSEATKNQEPTFCIFCMGSGKQKDPVLLRLVTCVHCNGTGCYDEEQEKP